MVPTPQVDGGLGSSMDEVLATVQTIGAAMAKVGQTELQGLDMLIRNRRDNQKQADIAREWHCDQGTVSRQIARAERALGKALAGSGLLPERDASGPTQKKSRQGLHIPVSVSADVEMRPEVGGALQTAG
tara:strand:+ start:59 stop:448 length:390 start_codon:yes stop_codon:yes gene_type:complete